MSDLLPFLVACGIRDKVLDDMQNENSRIKEIIAANKSEVEVTGSGGFPTFAICNPRSRNNRFYSTSKTLHVHMLLDLEIHILGVDQPIKFLDMAKGDWYCERFGHLFRNGAANRLHIVADGRNRNRSALRFIQLMVKYATDDQLRIIRNVFDDANESNLKAFRDCNWTGRGSPDGMTHVTFVDCSFSGETYRTIESLRS